MPVLERSALVDSPLADLHAIASELGIDGQGDGVTAEIPDREDSTMIVSIKIEPTKAGDLRKQLTIRTDLDKETASITVQGDIEP